MRVRGNRPFPRPGFCPSPASLRRRPPASRTRVSCAAMTREMADGADRRKKLAFLRFRRSTQHTPQICLQGNGTPASFADVDSVEERSCRALLGSARLDRTSSADTDEEVGWCSRSFPSAKGSAGRRSGREIAHVGTCPVKRAADTVERLPALPAPPNLGFLEIRKPRTPASSHFRLLPLSSARGEYVALTY